MIGVGNERVHNILLFGIVIQIIACMTLERKKQNTIDNQCLMSLKPAQGEIK